MRNAIFVFCCFLLTLAGISEAQISIGIFTYKAPQVQPWDPDAINTGIPGSEEAVIYMSQELVKLGYKVVVLGQPPANSRYSLPTSNPRYINVDDDDHAKYDIAIAWRTPHEGERLKHRASLVYLWPHDTYHWKLSDKQINSFDSVFWLSDWHRNQWVSVNPGFSKFTQIFGNGINPDQFQLPIKERANPYSCIYGSNYARGLEIMLDIWPEIKNKYPRATLDIYYGWQHWGILSPDKEKKMRSQVAMLTALDVVDHGLVGHEELNRAYEKASLWTYPCIAPETFCITAIRAELAGAVPVIIEGSGLPTTVRHGYKCFSPEEYKETLSKAMDQVEKISLDDRKLMGEFVLKEYTWKTMANKWHALFEAQLKAKQSSEVALTR